MKCVEFGAEFADGANFYSNCGAKVNLEPLCQNCGKITFFLNFLQIFHILLERKKNYEQRA